MKDKSLHVKLVMVSLLEHNLNQRISHFRSFNSTRKVHIDESLAHLRVNLTQPYQTLGSWAFLSLKFNCYLPPCVLIKII